MTREAAARVRLEARNRELLEALEKCLAALGPRATPLQKAAALKAATDALAKVKT